MQTRCSVSAGITGTIPKFCHIILLKGLVPMLCFKSRHLVAPIIRESAMLALKAFATF